MIWYNDQLVRALQEARLVGPKPRPARVRRGTSLGPAVTIALGPAPVR